MDYALAKELKAAGFPQTLKLGDRFFPLAHTLKPLLITHHGSEHTDKCGPGNCECECNYCYPYACKDGLKVPTLEELIEACGEDFLCLTNGLQYGWSAAGLVYAKIRTSEKKEIFGNGKTHLEAVARLWLALNREASQ